METNYFTELNSINVSEKIETKNNLSYLSWAWAWGEIKKKHPTANYKIYETDSGCIYWNDGKTAWVKTGVIVSGIEHIEYLPIMDFKNKSIPLESITSFEANKSIQRSLTKAIARHGLGLYIYAGEDLPEEDEVVKKSEPKAEIKQEAKALEQPVCECGGVLAFKGAGMWVCIKCNEEYIKQTDGTFRKFKTLPVKTKQETTFKKEELITI